MSSVSSDRLGESIPFGRVVQRRKDTGAADLEPLSVYLEAGVVPRSSRDDNHNRLGADLSNYLAVEPGDIVFNKLRTWQGGLGVSRYRGIVSPAYFVCRPSPSFDPRFLHYLLRSSPYLAEFTRISKFMPPSQFDIAWDDLRLVPVPATHLPKQRAVADFLDTETGRIDALITKKRRMLELLHERHADAVETAIRGLAAEYGVQPLKRSVEAVTVGIVVTPSEWYSDHGVLALRGLNVRPGSIETSEVVYLTEEGHRLHAKSELRAGDVVVVRTGQAGAAAVVPPELHGANCVDLLIVRPGTMDSTFLSFVLNSDWTQKHIASHSVGSIQSHFNVGALRELPVPAAPTDAQASVATWLLAGAQQHLALNQCLAHQIALLQEHRQALITAAVTGELELSGVAA